MTFRESINNLIRGDMPESTSRALALSTGLFVLAWVSYALMTDKLPAMLPTLTALLAYICTLLGIKQWNERKAGDNGTTPADPPAPQ